MGFWCWLANNSSQLQSIGSVFAAIAAAVLIIVALRQARAANAQAEAAKVQAKAAEAQATVAKYQADLGIQQLGQALNSQDRATAPVLSVKVGDDGTATIKNCGLGPAFAIEVFYSDDPERKISRPADTLGVGQEMAFPWKDGHATMHGITVSCESSHRRKFHLVMGYVDAVAGFRQTYNDLGAPYDPILNMRFEDLHLPTTALPAD